jgi:uridine kinase
MNFLTTASINAAIKKDPKAFIALSETIYDNQIVAAANHIRLLADEKPIVLICGPSGSAKTSTAGRLVRCLQNAGTPADYISMDNYFLPRDAKVNIPKNPDGSVDYESPYRVDISLFHDHLARLRLGKPVVTPVFDFLTQSRRHGKTVERKNGGVVVIEGIHALNPVVTGDSQAYTFSLFVSVASRLIAPSGVSLNPSMIRLMRRLCRDCLYRGHDFSTVWKMYKSVSLGEENYINPFRERADLNIDTFIPYEAGVYRDFLLPDLPGISAAHPDTADLSDLLSVLESLSPLSPLDVPGDSVVREFIGNNAVIPQ